MSLPATLITFLPALHSACAPGSRDVITQTSMAQAAGLPGWHLGCWARPCQQKKLRKIRAKIPRILPQQQGWSCWWWRWEGICGRHSNCFFLDQMPLLGFKKLPFLWNPPARRVPSLSTACCLPWRAECPKSTSVPPRYKQVQTFLTHLAELNQAHILVRFRGAPYLP